MGSASRSVDTMTKMVEAGMNIAIINFSHATDEEKINVHYAKDIPSTVAASIDATTNTLDVKVIVAAILSRYTARKRSNLRPNSIILVACPNESVAYGLVLNFGVYPTIIPIEKTTDKLLADCIDKAKEILNLNKGDIVILSGDIPIEKNKRY